MKRRSQKLEILLDIQAVSCPGVWIPCNGAIYLSICLLGHYVRTKETAPVFPVKFHEKYLVEKVFSHVFHLADLDDILDAEVVYVELVQRFGDRPDTVLATFETSARELLFPNVTSTPQCSGADLDLLMEPTANFVGNMAPRLEISTNTTVEEVRTSLPPPSGGRATSAVRAPIAIPKTMRGRKPGERPPFRWRRAEPTLLGREPGAPSGRRQPRRRRHSLGAGAGRGRHCHCSCPERADSAAARRSASAERGPPTSSGGRPPSRARSVEPLTVTVDEQRPAESVWCSHCSRHHSVHRCSVCEAYQRYFGRDYPGHYHHDCCDCLCPVTASGVRHICGGRQPPSVRPATSETGSRASDTSLAQVWEDFVESSSSRKNDKRRVFYEHVEDFYRRMYNRAARRAVKNIFQD